MKPGKVRRLLLRILAALALLAAFVSLDWYPMVKDLGRLRRERSDLERRIRDYRTAAATFAFPDEWESSLLEGTEAELCRALPLVADDDGWTALVLTDVQARAGADRIPHARLLFHWQVEVAELGTAGREGADPLAPWISQQFVRIHDGFSIVFDPDRFPWNEVLSGLDLHPGRSARRPVCVVAMAPLPALLNFVNRVSWGETRLEIVRFQLEPGIPFSRAWLVCRSTCRMRSPPWGWETRTNGGEGLSVDPDSPLLLQKADPLLAPAVEKRELPPPSSERGGSAGSPW